MTDAAGLRHVGGRDPELEPTERLGVEEEFHVVDLATRELVARGPELLERLSPQFTAELQKSVVESNSSVFDTLDELAPTSCDCGPSWSRSLTTSVSESLPRGPCHL